ncbi:hypothetical protein [Streptacidiphilus rugosus]|uniref:hypothetical protein n=1 Tax=Streptacidiphilus rugosus TaxID=405783 RepID=UPI00056C5247|nr:hypothetical protein [Streptacidiphilus rugosus]
MRAARYLAASLLAGSVGIVGVVPAAHATAAKPAALDRIVGQLQMWVNGLPQAVSRGRTIETTIWYRQQSPDRLAADAFLLHIQNAASPANSTPPGVSVSWLDPITGSWTKSTSTAGGWYQLHLPQSTPVWVTSGYFAHVQARITFSSNARPGTWHVTPYLGEWWLAGGNVLDAVTYTPVQHTLSLR